MEFFFVSCKQEGLGPATMTLADLEKLEAKLRKSPTDANLQLDIGACPRAPAPRWAGGGRVAGRRRATAASTCKRRVARRAPARPAVLLMLLPQLH